MTPTPSLLLRMLTRFFAGACVVFWLGGLSYATSRPQASQRPPQTATPQSYPAEQVKAGAPLFAAQCGFCHGRDAMGGETGPDLTRSPVVAEDVRGDKIIPVVRGGRPDKGMPPFNLPDADLAAIVAFIHDTKTKAESLEGNRRDGRGRGPADRQRRRRQTVLQRRRRLREVPFADRRFRGTRDTAAGTAADAAHAVSQSARRPRGRAAGRRRSPSRCRPARRSPAGSPFATSSRSPSTTMPDGPIVSDRSGEVHRRRSAGRARRAAREVHRRGHAQRARVSPDVALDVQSRSTITIEDSTTPCIVPASRLRSLAGIAAAARVLRARRGAGARPGRAAQPASRQLAHVSRRLLRPAPQPPDADHAGERPSAHAGVGVSDRSDPARSRPRPILVNGMHLRDDARQHLGDRRADGPPALALHVSDQPGLPHRPSRRRGLQGLGLPDDAGRASRRARRARRQGQVERRDRRRADAATGRRTRRCSSATT